MGYDLKAALAAGHTEAGLVAALGAQNKREWKAALNRFTIEFEDRLLPV